MKKIYLPLLILFLVPTAFVQANFTDVPLEHENYDAVSVLKDYGIVQGYENGSFGVDELVSRGEFLKMVLLAEANNPNRTESATSALFPFGGEDEIVVDPFCFTDFDSTQWFEPYACWAKEQNLIEGYPTGDFMALDSVNFAEAAKILLGVSNGYDFEPGEYHWSESYVLNLSDGEIPASIKSLSQNLTRGQSVELVFRHIFMNEDDSSKSHVQFYPFNGQFIAVNPLGEAMRTSYIESGGNVYASDYYFLDDYELSEADLKTFEFHYASGYFEDHEGSQKDVSVNVAVDQFNVFGNYGLPIEGSAGGSFEFFGGFEGPYIVSTYGRDDEHVYMIECYEGCSIKMLPDSDVDTFELLDHHFSRDADHLYYYYWELDSAQIDLESFEVLGVGTFRDENSYYSVSKDELSFNDEKITPLKLEEVAEFENI